VLQTNEVSAADADVGSFWTWRGSTSKIRGHVAWLYGNQRDCSSELAHSPFTEHLSHAYALSLININ